MAARQSVKYGIAAVVIAVAIIGAALLSYNALPGQNTGSSSMSQLSSSFSSASGTTGQQSGSTSSTQSAASQGGFGTLSIYLTDAPPSGQTLKYLLVNVSSVELRYEGNISTAASTTTTSTNSSTASTNSTTSTTSSASRTSTATTPQNSFIFVVPASVGENVNLTSLHGQGLLLGATSAPAGNITAIVLNITGAKAFLADGTSAQLKVVADGKLMIPINFRIQPNGSADLTLDLTPNEIHISQGTATVLTPVIHVTVVEKAQGSTTTHTTEVTQSSSTTSTSQSTT